MIIPKLVEDLPWRRIGAYGSALELNGSLMYSVATAFGRELWFTGGGGLSFLDDNGVRCYVGCYIDHDGNWCNPFDDLVPSSPPGLTERIVTSETGGQKGTKPCQLGAIDPVALEALGNVAGYGATKYDRLNFLRGYDWSLSIDALYRHFLAFQRGEDIDGESGNLHIAQVAWHALALASFYLRDIGTDDRPKY